MKVFQLRDIPDLEAYCYCVAGVVGEMLTGIFCQHPDLSPVRAELEKYQTKFGLALQVTNIAKDYEKDVASGWCYIPASVTEKYGIEIEKLTDLSVLEKKMVLSELIPALLQYFDSTLKYITTIPETARPIRMFCIVPFVLAYNTIQKITEMKANKLSQHQVRSILVKCDSYSTSNRLLERDYSQVKDKLFSWAARSRLQGRK